MSKLNKVLISTIIIFSLLMIVGAIGSVAAADFTVNNGTSQKNITDWMKDNTTLNGDNLVFNVSSYELDDTLNVNKQINIKSDKNTQIIFNKNKDMFNISGSGANFYGLILTHNGKGTYDKASGAIYSNASSTILNINDITINLNNNYLGGVVIKNWVGNISNTNLNSHETAVVGLASNNWVGNMYNCYLSLNNLSSYGVAIFSNWVGTISGSKIYVNGYNSIGFYANTSSKSSISNSVVQAKNGIAISVSKYVKVSNTSTLSTKGHPGVYGLGPRLSVAYIRSFYLIVRTIILLF